MQIADRIAGSFTTYFSSTNARTFFSPGRINFIGEHIDYNDGFVMPAAIDKGVCFTIAPNHSNTIHFVAADINERFSVSIDAIEKQDGWKNYVLGILYVLQKEGFSIGGFDCVFGGNLPQGSGLSSSAAIEAGLLFSLNEIFQLGIPKVRIATMAQHAEHVYPGTQCGIMDMFASLHGKKEQLILLDCTSLQYEYLPFTSQEYDVVLINTRVHHSLASGEYNTRRKECREGLAILQTIDPAITSFRQVDPAFIEQHKASFAENIYKRCLYVTQEIRRTQQGAQLLKENNIPAFGKLMFETHAGLSKLYEVSCAELDFLVDEAKKYEAVTGARVMGGGFGGCTINLIKKNDREAIVTAITAAYLKAFNVAAEVYIVEPADGTYEIKA